MPFRSLRHNIHHTSLIQVAAYSAEDESVRSACLEAESGLPDCAPRFHVTLPDPGGLTRPWAFKRIAREPGIEEQ